MVALSELAGLYEPGCGLSSKFRVFKACVELAEVVDYT